MQLPIIIIIVDRTRSTHKHNKANVKKRKNFGRISYRFRDVDAFSSEIACFPHRTLV